jgi:hypothetical protein
MVETTQQARNYITTNLFAGKASDFGAFSVKTPSHENMQYHQIVMVASGGITGAYKVRFAVFEGENQLEYTANTGKLLAFTGGKSSIAQFEGSIRGIHLEVSTAFSSGETVSCVLSSSVFPFSNTLDVYDGAAPDTSVPLEGWRDLRMALVASATGSGAPAIAAFGPSANIKQLAFGINDSVYVAGHIDHDIKVGSTCYMHVHWSTNGTNVQPVKWQMSYITAAGHNQANFGSDTVITVEEAAQGTAWRHMITEDSVGFVIPEVDSLFACELKRITNGATDNSDTVFGLFMDIHYQTQQYATPSRTPDFYTP